MHFSIKLFSLLVCVLALAPATSVAAKSETPPTIKPMPKELLNKLTITFDKNGKPVFSPKKGVKAVECDPASTRVGSTKRGDLPSCGPAGYSNATGGTTQNKDAKTAASTLSSAQPMDTQCYTIYWVQDGVVYSYTFCWDNTSTQ